jgi:hypothetical protein
LGGVVARPNREKPTAKATCAAFRKVDSAVAARKKCRTISRIFPAKAGQQIIVPVKYQKVRQFAHPCTILLCGVGFDLCQPVDKQAQKLPTRSSFKPGLNRLAAAK